MRAFRRATRDDAKVIAALHDLPHVRETIGRAPTEVDVLERLADPDFGTFVVERDDDAVGFVLVSVEDGWHGTIRRVISARPGRGDGTFAMTRSLRHLFDERSAHRASLEVVVSNVGARRLYERLGFVYEGTWREGYRTRDGSFLDLCAYGLLAREFRASAL